METLQKNQEQMNELIMMQLSSHQKAISDLENNYQRLRSRIDVHEAVLTLQKNVSDVLGIMQHFVNNYPELSARSLFTTLERSFSRTAFFTSVKSHPNLVIVAETTEGVYFGVTVSRQIKMADSPLHDENIALFIYRPENDEARKFQLFQVKEVQNHPFT